MENIVFTQLSISELRAILRQELEAVLSQQKSISAQSDPEEIGDIALAQKITGLARPTIYGLVAQSKIPCMKRGKKLYFSRQELSEWIKQGRRKTTDEIEVEARNYVSAKGEKYKARRF